MGRDLSGLQVRRAALRSAVRHPDTVEIPNVLLTAARWRCSFTSYPGLAKACEAYELADAAALSRRLAETDPLQTAPGPLGGSPPGGGASGGSTPGGSTTLRGTRMKIRGFDPTKEAKKVCAPIFIFCVSSFCWNRAEAHAVVQAFVYALLYSL